jgi:hypothetical protein
MLNSVDVGQKSRSIRFDRELQLQDLSIGVCCRSDEGRAMAQDGMLDDLSGAGHANILGIMSPVENVSVPSPASSR